ncbi:MAG: V-type ATP synthase subunit E family protein [Thermoplasmata archaeon]|jgi:vacuolar-type H+-ATPase subunit E/Vma4
MTLEDLVEEIRHRGEADLAEVEAESTRQTTAVTAARDLEVNEIRSESERAIATEASFERTQRVAAAKLKSRRRLYEVREARLRRSLEETRTLLKEFTGSNEYPATLRRMVGTATSTLGKQLKITGRVEDAAVLAKVAGKSFDPTPQPILGGLISETPDGKRRLNLSFDELLRLNEDRLRDLLA